MFYSSGLRASAVFSLAASQPAGNFYKGGITWGDFIGDNNLDLIVFGNDSGTNRVKLYKGNGGSFWTSTSNGITTPGTNGAISAADATGDGLLDIAISNDSSDLTIYEGKPTATWFTSVYSGEPFEYCSQQWVDIDADGDLDLFISGHIRGTVYLKTYCIYNNPAGFTAVDTGLPGYESGGMAFGDYNQDGWPDLAITGLTDKDDPFSSASVLYKNAGFGEFEATTVISTSMANGSFSWYDYDGDGDLDLFFSGQQLYASPEERLYIFKNKGAAGNYDLEYSTWLPGVKNGQVICGDIDNDGDGDLFLVGQSSAGVNAFVYKYDSATGKFSVTQTLPPLGFSSRAEFADYNGDGDIDLYYCGQDTATGKGMSYLYENTCSTPNSPPPAPLNPTASVSAGYLVLKWDAPVDDITPSAALNYSIMMSTISNSSSTVSGCLASPFSGYNTPCKINGSPGAIFAGIGEGTTYYWKVRSIDGGFQTSGWTQEQVIFVKGVPPSPVSNLTALPGTIDGEITLQWTAPGNDGTYGRCESYSVKYSSDTANKIPDETQFQSAPVYTQSWTPKIGGWAEQRSITGLKPGATFYFAIKGSDGLSYGSWDTSGGVNALRFTYAQDLVPSSPTWHTNPTSPGDSFINIRWNLNTEIDISSYTVEVSSGFAYRVALSTSHPNYMFDVTGLTNFATYYFRIRASDWTHHIGTWSKVESAFPYDTTPPGTVTSLDGQRGSPGEISLSWITTGDSGYSGNIVNGKFELAMATYSFSVSTAAFTSNFITEKTADMNAGASSNYTVTGLQQDTTYYFRMKLADEVPNWSGISNITYAKTVDTVPPSAVTSLSGKVGNSPGETVLNWVSPGDNGNTGILNGGFYLDYSTFTVPESSASYKTVISTSGLPPGTGCVHTITGLIAGASYYFRLWSFDEEDNPSYASNVSTARAQPDSSPPSVFILDPVYSEPAKTYGAVKKISGTAADDYGSVASVRVSTSGASGPWHEASLSGGNWFFGCSTFSFASGGSYTFLAWGMDSYGNATSSYTVGISSVSFRYDSSPPLTVTDLAASTGTLSGYINLSWTAPADPPFGGSAAGYILKYASFTLADTTSWWNGAHTWELSAPSSPGTPEQAQVTGLQPGTTYWFRFESYDGADYFRSTSTYSNEPYAMARYGPDAVTYFDIDVASFVIKGIPAVFSVSCHNPDYAAVPASSATPSVSFTCLNGSFYPSSYSFLLSDAGTRTFTNGIIFDSLGNTTFYVKAGGITNYSRQITVSSVPLTDIGPSGGVISAGGMIKLTVPSGALDSPKKFSIDVLTDNSQIPSWPGGSPATAFEIVSNSAFPVVFSAAAEISCFYLDNDDDTYEDKTGISENSLGIFFYDGLNWRIIDDSPGLSAASVSAGNVFVSKIYRTGKYALLPRGTGTCTAASAKPKRKIITPYSAGSNDYIEFTGAKEPFTVTVYSASGKKVFEGKNTYTWGGTDSSGALLPGGLYFYELATPLGKTSGAVAIAK